MTVRFGKAAGNIMSRDVSCESGVSITVFVSADAAFAQVLQAPSQQAPVQSCSQPCPVSVALSCCCMSVAVPAVCMSIWWQGEVLSVAAGIEMAHAPRNGATASARAIMTRNHLCVRVCIIC